MIAKKELVMETTGGVTSDRYQAAVSQMQEELTKYGLSGNQSKVYIFLGKHGSKTAPEVSKSLKLPRTETYHLLTSLQNKGIVSATFQHPIKFKALPLNKAVWTLVNTEKERVRSLESQEKDLTKLWDDIPEFGDDSSVQEEEKFQMLKGSNQINSKITEMISGTQKEFLIFAPEKDLLRLYYADFLSMLNDAKVKYRVLTSMESPIDELQSEDVRKLDSKTSDILCYLVKDDSEVLVFTKNASYPAQASFAMWTNAQAMIYSNQLLFEAMWKKAKK